MSVNAQSVTPQSLSIYGGTFVVGRSFTSTYSFNSDYSSIVSSISGSITEPSRTITEGGKTYTEGSKTITVPSDITRYSVNSHKFVHSSTGDYTENSYRISDSGATETVSGSNGSISGSTDTVSGATDTVSLSVNTQNIYSNCDLDYSSWLCGSVTNLDLNKYYELCLYPNTPSVSNGSFSWQGSYYSIPSLGLYNLPFDRVKHILVKGSDLYYQNNDGSYFFGLFGSAHLYLTDISGGLSIASTTNCDIYEISKTVYDSNAGQTVHDSGTQQGIKHGNEIAQDSNDVQHDTNNKVTGFFNAFWDNLLHIFVPEDGFFSSWFNELNDFFAAKLGFLYSPFDFIISFFNGVLNTVGTQEHGFTIPALTWEGTEFCPEVNFSFDMFAEQFPQLQEAVYFFSDVVIILALMRGIRSKLDLVMGVHEE